MPDYAGARWLGPLYRAVRAGQGVRLRYRAFGVAQGWDETVEPYLLKQYNHRWFLVGTGSGRPGISHYALDRIEDAAADATLPYGPAPADLAAWFADVVGASVPAGAGPPERVLLRFGAGRGPYVLTKPLHPSQAVERDTAEFLEISLRVVPNQELETVLLGFGEDVEVVEPPALRARVAARLRAAAGRYA